MKKITVTFVNNFHQVKEVKMSYRPNLGDQVSVFGFTPNPKVVQIVLAFGESKEFPGSDIICLCS